jgi:hypothetical protein
MIAIQQQANPKAWNDVRHGRFTASCIGKLMTTPRLTKEMKERIDAGAVFFGDTAETYIAQVAAERATGVRERNPSTYSMKRGIVLEEAAIHLLTKDWTPIDGCAFMAYGENSGATPDGLLFKGTATMDLKCPEAYTDVLRFGVEVPDNDFDALEAWDKTYAWQVMHQAKCAGVKEAWLVYFTDRLPWIKLSEEDRDIAQQIIDFACDRLAEGSEFPFGYTFGSDGYFYVARRFELTQERSDKIDRVLMAAEVECVNMQHTFKNLLNQNQQR